MENPTAAPVESTQRGPARLSTGSTYIKFLLFLLIISVGISRALGVSFPAAGLNQDEASSGLNATTCSIWRGPERDFLPIIILGQRPELLYATACPGCRPGGLSPFTVRLPMLIAGILTLPLVYLIGKRMPR